MPHASEARPLDSRRITCYVNSVDFVEDAGFMDACDVACANTVIGYAKAARSGLEKVFGQLCDGDIFVVWQTDRLERSVKDLIEKVEEGRLRRLFKNLKERIDAITPGGELPFCIFGAFSEYEIGSIH